MTLLAADAPKDPLAPASITALVKIRAIARRLRAKGHANVTLVPHENGDVSLVEAVETYQLRPGEDENEFLAQVWARYKQGGHRAIRLSAHDDRLTAHISRRIEDERIAALAEQLAQVSAQLASFNHYLDFLQTRGHDPQAIAAYELEHKEFSGA